MPVPSVIWETGEWRLRMQAEATASGNVRVRYGFENLTADATSARLFVLVRPVSGHAALAEFRSILGGVSRIHDLAWRDGARAGQCSDADRAARPRAARLRRDRASTKDSSQRYLAAGELPTRRRRRTTHSVSPQAALCFELAPKPPREPRASSCPACP